MIYTKESYRVKFFQKLNKEIPIIDFLERLTSKESAKILKYIDFLRENEGCLDEPYTKYIKNKIRELRIDFGKKRYRIFYFCSMNKKIILLHIFFKKSKKIPDKELKIAFKNYHQVINNLNIYE